MVSPSVTFNGYSSIRFKMVEAVNIVEAANIVEATDRKEHRMSALRNILENSSFDVKRMYPMILSVISRDNVGKLSLEGITDTSYWIQKINFLHEKIPEIQFTFKKEDCRRIRFFRKKIFFPWYSKLLPRQPSLLPRQPSVVDLRQSTLDKKSNCSSVVPSECYKIFESKLPQVKVSLGNFRTLISILDNTSSALNVTRKMLLGVKAVSMQASSQACSPELNLVRHKDFDNHMGAHLERRLILFYASIVATVAQIEDFPMCELVIGKTIYQIGKGNAVEVKSDERFEAAHSAIIPNILIKLDFRKLLKEYDESKEQFGKKLDELCARFNPGIESNSEKLKALELLKKKISDSKTADERTKVFHEVGFESLFCKSLIPEESYLGQNLASTVCLPKYYNDFDGLVENTLRNKSIEILNKLFKANICESNMLKISFNASKKFNSLFVQALIDIQRSCQIAIQKSQNQMEQISRIKEIIALLESKDDRQVGQGLRDLSIIFNDVEGFLRCEDIRRIKDLVIRSKGFVEDYIKERISQTLPENERLIIDRMFNFKETNSVVDSIDNERLVEIVRLIFSEFKKICSSTPYRDDFSFTAADDAIKGIQNRSLAGVKLVLSAYMKKIVNEKLFICIPDSPYNQSKVAEQILGHLKSLMGPDGPVLQFLKTVEFNEFEIKRREHLAIGYLKQLKDADDLAELYFKEISNNQDRALNPGFGSEFQNSKCHLNTKLGSGCEQPEAKVEIELDDKQSIKKACQSLLKPYVNLVQVRSSTSIPHFGFQNETIWFQLKCEEVSQECPVGLKLIIDKPKLRHMPLFNINLKKAIRELCGENLKLKLGGSIWGVFEV